jgi:mRNA interferase RelE/StbE
MQVEIDEKALKDLQKIDKRNASKILNKIESLEKFPEIPNFKKLTNFYPPFRLRVGDYRVLFDVENEKITVFRIKHRREVYK